MKLDRNTVVGFLLLAVLLIGYFIYTSKEQAAFRAKKAKEDSIANANKPKPVINSNRLKLDSVRADTVINKTKAGQYQSASLSPVKDTIIDNGVLRITFSTKGGQPKKVELKNFKGVDSSLVKLASTDFDKIDYAINTSDNSSDSVSKLNFQLDTVITAPGNVQTISYSLVPDSGGAAIHHQYVIRPNDYLIDFTISFNGADKQLTQGNLNMTWQYKAIRQESDLNFEKQNTQVGYVEDGSFDYHTIGRRTGVEFNKPLQWLGVRQRFFTTMLVAKNKFSGGQIQWEMPNDNKTVMQAVSILRMQLPVAKTATVPLSIYYGPADYHILTQYDLGFGKLINLGQGPYAFVRPLNKYVVMPIFDMVRKVSGSSLGLAIALLTIIIRLLISPLTYSSYLSGAKMKVLRPEIAKLREKYGSDQQQMSMEQMKLFREAGVNPLGGCIPALLQIPIFFALYSFFNSNISLRGQSFLWAKDLSAADDVIKFGTHIPLLGDHLSLFTITAVVTSFLISLYSMSMSPDQSNPMMKWLPYIFPFFLLFIFNSLPSALTWYYTVSNIITLALQFVIQTYIIDHDKILAKMEANRKKPKTKTKWQERMEQMQEQQKRLRESQQKSKK